MAVQKIIKQIGEVISLSGSKVMGDQLAQLIKYCRLSGIDYKAVLDEYYTKGLLPCESKREGKKCLFELKQRLL